MQAKMGKDVVQPWTWTEMIGTGLGAAVGGIGATMLGVGTFPLVAGIVGMGIVGRAVGQEVRKRRDPFRSVVIDEDDPLEDIKSDVDAAMVKIKSFIKGKTGTSLNKRGRDHYFYGPFQQLNSLIEKWTPQWDLASTAGLLLDLQSAIKGIKELHTPVPDGGSLSEEQRKIREVGYTTEFGREIKANFDVQANPSATSANLLTFLRTIAPGAGITDLEIEAIVKAVIMFWEKRAKRFTGDFHTPVEVWMAYTRHRELVAEKNK